ncbi:MAG: hypothetical protein K940chlam1_00010 [Candidatus Anoxychlamydiales bacterium]|nr:hypothetical protein [Candidatus Anoxychlamydiales bacterium]NGX36664.1 hypothetical protein [Candidatus Anoxychlamydiales bacterium]
MQLSIFDLDRTLLKTNISFKFYLYLYKKNFFNKKSIFEQVYFFIRFKYFNMPLKKLHEIVFKRSLKNKSYKDLIKNIDVFLDKYLDKLFYQPAILKLQKAIFEKHYIAIFSSSPSFLVKPIAKILKVDEYKATEYLLDKEDKFDEIDLIMDGNEKAKQATLLMNKLKILKKDVIVYSDNIDDLKLFDLAAKKIAVRPCSKLSKLSKQNSWEII